MNDDQPPDEKPLEKPLGEDEKPLDAAQLVPLDDQKPERDEKGRLLPGHRWAWRPGVSGNPAGRPIRLETLIADELKAKLPNDPDPERTKAKFIAQMLVQKAMRGDMRAILAVLDRNDGPMKHRIEIDHYDESESQTDLIIEVVDVQVTSAKDLPDDQ